MKQNKCIRTLINKKVFREFTQKKNFNELNHRKRTIHGHLDKNYYDIYLFSICQHYLLLLFFFFGGGGRHDILVLNNGISKCTLKDFMPSE